MAKRKTKRKPEFLSNGIRHDGYDRLFAALRKAGKGNPRMPMTVVSFPNHSFTAIRDASMLAMMDPGDFVLVTWPGKHRNDTFYFRVSDYLEWDLTHK